MMNNQEIISKLTLGTDETETVKVIGKDGEELDVTLRPLSSGELSILQKMEKKPYTMQMKLNKNGERIPVDREDMLKTHDPDKSVDIGMGDFIEASNNIMFNAVAWSMDVSVKTVQGFYKGVPKQLFEHVLRISNITDEDLDTLKGFRK